MGRSRLRESLSVLLSVVLVVSVVASGTVVLTDTAQSRAENVGISASEIKAGNSFTVSYVDDSADDGSTMHVVLDTDGDGTYDAGDPKTTAPSDDDSLATSTTFSDTDGLDGTYSVYVYEGPDSLSTGTDLTTAGSATITIDGSPPWISEFNLTNPAGQQLKLTMVADERLQTHEADLSGPESATLTTFAETNGTGTYTYTATYNVSTDGDYTASLRTATDDFDNEVTTNQTLSDAVTVDTTPPTVESVETAVGAQRVRVVFSEGVTDATGGALTAADFTYDDANAAGAATISGVSHTAGTDAATLVLDAAVGPTDLGNDTIGPRTDAIFDAYDNPAGNATTELADTESPAAPLSASSRPVNASNHESYDLAVTLADDHEAGTLDVAVSDGSATVRASATVANRTDGDADPHTVSFTGLNLSTLADGQLSVEANLTDYGGNAAGATVATPTKDTTVPTVADASISNAPIGTYDVGTQQTVTVEFDETMATTDQPNVTISGLNRSYDVTGGGFADATTWTGTVSIADDDEDTQAAIRVADATDAEGNSLAPDASNTFRVNTTGPAKPEATRASDIDASNASDYAATVELVSGTDADEVRVRVGDGTNVVVANASVGATQTNVTVSGIDASSLADGSVTVESMTLDDGYPNIEGFVEETTVEKDTVAPSVSGVAIEGGGVNDSTAGTVQQVTVSFSEQLNTSRAPTVTVSGLNRSYAVTGGSYPDATTWTGTLTVADDEETTNATLTVADAADGVGNPIGANAHEFRVDTDTPSVSNLTVTNPADRQVAVSFESDQQLSAVGVTLDTPTGTVTLDRSDFAETGTGPYSYEATHGGSADGTYEAALDRAADDMGNDGAAGGTDATTVDVTGPTFAAASPAGTTVADNRTNVGVDISDATNAVNASSIELTVTDAEGTKLDAAGTGAAGVTFSGGRLAFDPAAAGVSFADGDVTVTAAANDSVGNRANATFSFRVDTTAPTFGDGSPNATVEDSRPAVNVSIDDATGVASSSLAVTVTDSAGTKLDAAGTAAPGVTFSGGRLAFDPAAAGVSLADGDVTVTVAANDTLDNRRTTTFSFRVDTPPDISGFDAAASGGNVTVSFDSTDQLTNVSVGVSGPNGTDTLATPAFGRSANGAGGYEYAASFDPGPDGEYDFRLDAATDPQGDGATGQTATAVVDRADPEPTGAWIRDADASSTTLTVEFSEPVDTSSLAAGDVSVQNATVTSVSGTASETTSVNVTVSGHVPTDDAPALSFDAGSYAEAVGDGSGGTGSPTNVHTLRMSLSAGENFVSVPAVEGNVSLAALDLTGVETVWTYDDNRWQSYDPDAPANDFSSLVGGKGYVFVANRETAIDVTVQNVADGPTRSERLEDGWNLVGHWEEGDRPAGDALGTVQASDVTVFAQRTDSTLDYRLVDLQTGTFESGEAYWVLVSENATYNTTSY
ncbi:beta strand repeat-containing protein [Halorussus caseinilyticus]|uniref:Beta strand repeat-containing protein n=1 Tax=Halorussus caseinilyticus TaxID=3034025 RepID=A0ABD5WKW5_9EURY|nr:Ig-like domain-containing protein [Halorussus sp. DT72]